MYAINIADWQAVRSDIGLQVLLMPVVDRSRGPIHTADGNFDEMGMILVCGEDRAREIVKLVRKGYKKHQLRLYYSKTGQTWKRV